MIIYRPHKSSLQESMNESVELETIEDMKNYIVGKSNGFISSEYIVLGKIHHEDARIGWKDARLVCVSRYGKEDYVKKFGYPQCIGMYATKYQGVKSMKLVAKDQGQAVVKAMNEKMVSMKEVIVDANITRPTLWRIRKGDAVNKESAEKVANYLGKDIKELFEVK